MATTGYNAGIDSSDVTVSFVAESAWNVVPTTPTFQYVRLTGEGLSETKSRARPAEIRSSGDAAHAITQSVEAGGNLNFAFSYETYDAWLEALINSTPFPAGIDITSSGTDVSSTSSGFTNTGGFANAVVGQWVNVRGFAAATENGVYRVTAADNDSIDVSLTEGNGPNLVGGETSVATEVTISGSSIRNGTEVCTFQIEKMLASSLFLNYGGCYVTGGSISAQVGSFMEGSFDFFAAAENKGTTTLSTGGTPTAAPTGSVMDTVSGFQGMSVGGALITAVAQGIDINVSKEGARGQYGLGSAAAQGMARGTIMVSGSISFYFGDFSQYDLYKSEADTLVSFAALDSDNKGYVFTLPAATIMNPSIVAGGPDTDIVAEFELEGNPAPSSDAVYSGVTIQIDKV